MAEKKRSKRKCPICKTFDDIEKMEEVNGRYYHKENCLLEYKKIQEAKEVKKDDWGSLFDYICEIYNIEKPTGFMFKQLETFRKDYGYTDIGILLTLKYCFETLNINILEEAGLGIVPYYYDKAKKHNMTIWDLEDYLEEFDYEEKEKTINIKKKNNFNKDQKKKTFDFNNLLWEDEKSE